MPEISGNVDIQSIYVLSDFFRAFFARDGRVIFD